MKSHALSVSLLAYYDAYIKIINYEKILKELSEEELKLLEYFNQGESYKTIKEKYGITLYTNDPRVMNLYDKFDVLDRGELIKKISFVFE